MPSAFDLPPELRLDIYQRLVTRPSGHIYINERDTTRQQEWLHAQRLMEYDTALAADIRRMYWRHNTFLIPGTSPRSTFFFLAPRMDAVELERWLDKCMGDNVKDLNSLLFGVSGCCPERTMSAPYPCCSNVLAVDIQGGVARTMAPTGGSDRCQHAESIAGGMRDVLARMAVVDGQKQPSVSTVWKLYRCCGQ